jgi:hypothetical protein
MTSTLGRFCAIGGTMLVLAVPAGLWNADRQLVHARENRDALAHRLDSTLFAGVDPGQLDTAWVRELGRGLADAEYHLRRATESKDGLPRVAVGLGGLGLVVVAAGIVLLRRRP